MSDYYEIYRRRLNRYGLDYQSRIQNQRERDFDNYLYKTIYRVDFQYDGQFYPASLERYKQDHTETQGYLLTKVDVKLPSGTVLMIQSQNGKETPWMVWWLEQIEASGYNRYVVLKMTHLLQWEAEDGTVCEQWGFFSGPGTAAIKDTTRSSTGKPIYNENNNLYTFITAYNPTIVRGLYFEVGYEQTQLGYVVTELDINSTPGLSYVSVDPVPLRDKSEKPTKEEDDKTEDYFWLNGGVQ